MTTVESAIRSSVWTITANRRPRSRPCPRGSAIAWTSPRTTQLFHQISYLERLLDVFIVCHEPACFGGESSSAAIALGGLSDGLAGGFGAGDTSASGDFVERAQTIGSEAEREWWRSCRHKTIVARTALHTSEPLRPRASAVLSFSFIAVARLSFSFIAAGVTTAGGGTLGDDVLGREHADELLLGEERHDAERAAGTTDGVGDERVGVSDDRPTRLRRVRRERLHRRRGWLPQGRPVQPRHHAPVPCGSSSASRSLTALCSRWAVRRTRNVNAGTPTTCSNHPVKAMMPSSTCRRSPSSASPRWNGLPAVP